MIVIAYVVAEICHHYIVSKTYANFTRNYLSKTGPRCMYSYKYTCGKHRGYLFFSVKDRHLFHRVDTIGDIFTSGAAEKKKKPKYYVYFMLLTLSGRGFIKIQYSSFPLFSVLCPFRIATNYNITSSARNVR